MCAPLKTARTARRIAVSHVDRGLDLRAHTALNLRAAARTLISLPKSQLLKIIANFIHIGVDMNPFVGDYGFVVNSSTRIAKVRLQPGIGELS